MSITLESSVTLAGQAEVASKLTITVTGDEVTTTTGADDWKRLYGPAYLPSAAGTIVTVGALVKWIISSIHVVNTDTSARYFQLWTGGTAGSNALTPQLTIPAGGMAVYDSAGWKVLDSTGRAQTSVGSVPTGTGFRHVTAGAEDAAAKLVDTADINPDQVTYPKIQNVSATDRLLGRDTAAAGDIEELTVGGGVEFTGSGGIQRSALTGDVTATAGSNATTIANDAVTYAKMQNISATARILGRTTAGAGDTEELTGAQALAITGGSANPHGAADHTDITRKVTWWGAGMTADGSTGNTRGTFPDGIRVLTFADAATQGGHINMSIPKDAVAAQPLNIVLYWLPNSTDATPHTVRWSVNAKALVAGTDATAAGTTTAFTGSSAARTANQMVIEASTQILASASADDVIRLDIRRVGADAADTYVGAVDLVMFDLLYTSNQ